MTLQVVTQTMNSPHITFAQPLPFQFDLDGDAIISYCVVLHYFQLKYATDSSYNSEEVGEVGVRLLSNLIGDTVMVTPQLLLTDGDGSAGSEDQDVNGRDCFLKASVIAWVASSPPASQTLQLLNAYGIQGTSPGTIPINSSASYQSFLSGFAAAFGDSTVDEINGLSVSTSSSVEGGTALTLTTTTDLVGHSTASNHFTDTGLVAFTDAIDGLKLLDATADVGKDASSDSGIDGTLTADLTIPDGYTKIIAAVPLIDSFAISFSGSDAHHLQEFAAGITDGPGFPGNSTTFPITGSGNQTWNLHFNLWGERNFDSWYISNASLSAKVLAQFA